MRKLGMMAVVVGVLTAAGFAVSAVRSSTVTWGGLSSVLADSGVLAHSDVYNMGPAGSGSTGFLCTFPTVPNGTYDTVQVACVVSNDGTNFALQPGVADAGTTVTDAGAPTQISISCPVAAYTFQALSIGLSGAANASTVSCTMGAQ